MCNGSGGRRRSRGLAALAAVVGVLYAGSAAQAIPVAGKSLTAKRTSSGKQSVKSTQSDPAVDYGGATGGTTLTGRLDVYYADTPTNRAILEMPPPWVSNNGLRARFANKSAPAGPTPVKSATVATARSVTVSSAGLAGLDISTAPGANGVITVFSIENGPSKLRMCTQYAAGLGSTVAWKPSGSGFSLTAKKGVGITCPATCDDGIQNGGETGVDCGGPTSCPRCAPGGGCASGSDCASGVCSGGICQTPSCSDGVKNGNETGIDCGGGTCPACAAGGDCNLGSDCASGVCIAGACRCQNHTFDFHVDASGGGAFSIASWPGGTQSQTNTAGCTAHVQNPDAHIDLVCTLANPFAILGFAGYSNCFGTGGEDGDGVDTPSCDALAAC